MNQLKLLDCTLRDGGYINDWSFGEKNIHAVMYGLASAGIDVVEVGYLSGIKEFDRNSTQFTDIRYLSSILPVSRKGTKFVGMVDFGKLSLEQVPDRDSLGLDGIRIAFHKKMRYDAMHYAEELGKKGYDIYLQPMVALSYTDEEYLELISMANAMEPTVFYIVDSFGAMRKDDLLHMVYLVDYNLKHEIGLGFHSHNNLQLSYSLAQILCGHPLCRNLVIDSSIHGMGRGAGNLNTELFAEYLNEYRDGSYDIKALLRIADNIIAPIYQRKFWGYSLPFYLSATHNCHPNYAVYLDEQNTLTAENINEIFSMMDPERKSQFDRSYIKELYLKYQSENKPITNLVPLKEKIAGHEVIVVAPGKSIMEEKDIVKAAAKGKIVIALNHNPSVVHADYVFVSNHRRWETMEKQGLPPVILTSNIQFENGGTYVADYATLLNDVDAVKDNAGMMLISLLISMGVAGIWLAGMDGYAVRGADNFSYPELEFNKRDSVLLSMNEGMTEMLRRFGKQIPITFVTKPRYVMPEEIGV